MVDVGNADEALVDADLKLRKLADEWTEATPFASVWSKMEDAAIS
jgi:hypothetical protein